MEAATLASFVDITGADEPVARQWLQATEWQLESALQLFFADSHEDGPRGENQGAPEAAAPPPEQPQIPSEDLAALAGVFDYVRPPLPVKREALYDDTPLYRAHQMAQAEPQRTVIDAFRNFREEAEERTRQRSGESAAESEEGPKDALAALFRPPFEIMFQGSIEQAKSEGTKQNKWLLVNVQSNNEFASHTMNRDTWAHEAVKETVGSYFIFWQIYDNTEEGAKVCTYYKLSNMPVTMVLDPQTGQKLRAWEGMIGAARLLEDVVPFMDRGPLDQKGPKRLRDSTARNSEAPTAVSGNGGEEAELRAAIAASLEAPSSSASSALSRPETSASSGPEKEAQAAPPLPQEPQPSAATCRVAVRFPNGVRGQRLFLRSDPIKYLRSFCCQQVPEAAAGRPFRLAQSIPGAAPLDLAGEASMDEQGLANSMLAMTWLHKD